MSKTYVIMMNYDVMKRPYRFVREEDEHWVEVAHPDYATTYACKKDALEFIKIRTAHSEYAKVIWKEEADRLYRAWEEESFTIAYRNYTQPKLNKPYDPNMSREDVLAWWIAQRMAPDSAVTYANYRTYPELWSLYTHLHGVELYSDPDGGNREVTVAVCVPRDSEFDTFKAEVMSVLDRITYNDDGELVLPVFDHYLSAGGNSVYIYYDRDKDKWSTYRYGSMDYEFKTMRALFDYLKRERYYD